MFKGKLKGVQKSLSASTAQLDYIEQICERLEVPHPLGDISKIEASEWIEEYADEYHASGSGRYVSDAGYYDD